MTHPTVFADILPYMPSSMETNTIIAPCQKAIHDFHESHHPTQPVADIYSRAWQSRLAAWYAWFAQSQHHHQPLHMMAIRKNQQQHSPYHHVRPTASLAAQICQSPEDLDLRVLFFTNPVLTFALWGVLQAFYALDMAVCEKMTPSSSSHSSSYSSDLEYTTTNNTSATAEEEEINTTLNHYHALSPLLYLTSSSVRHTWQLALETLDADIRSGRLVGGELETRLWRIYEGVEGLEDSVKGLLEDFGGEGSLAVGGFVEGGEQLESGLGAILELVRNVMDERCLMIDEILGREDGVESDEIMDTELRGAHEEGSWVMVAV